MNNILRNVLVVGIALTIFFVVYYYVVFLQKKEIRTFDSDKKELYNKVQVIAEYDSKRSKCPYEYPIKVSIKNSTDKKILKTTIELHAYLTGYSDDKLSYGEYLTTTKILDSGADEIICFKLSSNVEKDPYLDEYEYVANVKDVDFQ